MDQLQPRSSNAPYVLRAGSTVAVLKQLRESPNTRNLFCRREVPGDFVVDRDMKTAYMIGRDGARKRLHGPTATYVINEVKRENGYSPATVA